MRTVWSLLRGHRDLRLLLSANLVSLTGDWIVDVGIAFYVYDLTDSTLASAGALLCAFLPAIFLSSFAGVFVDRWNRKTTLIVTNLLAAVVLLPLLAVHDRDHVWIIYFVTTCVGILQQFAIPAGQALLPRVVEDEQLVSANAVNGQTRELARLIGPAVGGIIINASSLSVLTFVDAGTFLVAALCVSMIAVSGRPEQPPADDSQPLLLDEPDLPTPDPSSEAASGSRSVGQEWLAGLRLARSSRPLRVVFMWMLLVMIGDGIFGTLLAPFVKDVLNGDGWDFGLITSVQAIGGIAGGFAAASLGQRLSPVAMFGFGSIAFGLVDLTMFLYPSVFVAIWPAAACMAIVGLPGAVTAAGRNTLLQRNTTDAYRGRVFGALGVPQGVGTVTGTLIAGVLGGSVGIVPIISIQAAMGILAGIIILVALRDMLASGSDGRGPRGDGPDERPDPSDGQNGTGGRHLARSSGPPNTDS